MPLPLAIPVDEFILMDLHTTKRCCRILTYQFNSLSLDLTLDD